VPQAVRERLNTEINAAVRAPSYLRFLEAEGAQPAPLGLAEFGSALRADILRWRRVAAEARISVN
jgi:tripartite-type tricarboxylate transporter receptor subunit TctC